jgi:type 1 glutamine amidotransferase
MSTKADSLKILIVTGRDHFHHRWRHAAALVRDTLEAADVFDVRITEEFRGAGPETLDPYDCILVSYFGAGAPGEPEQRWGDRAERALFDFVRSGRGIVLLHTSFAMGGTWRDAHGDELLRLAAGLTGPETRRAPGDEFTVTLDDHDHPITRGLPASWEQLKEDKFVNLRWHPEARPHVLASAFDDPDAYLDGAYYAMSDAKPGPKLYEPAEVSKLPGVGRRHPVVWTNEHGDGRVFALTLGHVGAGTIEDAHATLASGREVGPTVDVAARTVGFVNLLRRGTEWAATGRVTLPVDARVTAAAA